MNSSCLIMSANSYFLTPLFYCLASLRVMLQHLIRRRHNRSTPDALRWRLREEDGSEDWEPAPGLDTSDSRTQQSKSGVATPLLKLNNHILHPQFSRISSICR